MGEIMDPRLSVTPKLIDEFHERMGALERPRPYLGVSILGHPCERWLWLQFRWAVREAFSGRMLRLFRRGQDEERSIARDLTHAGIEMSECLDNQTLLNFGCHISGHPDGIAIGVPEAPRTAHLVEMKTHNDKSFQQLKKQGVEQAKPMHFVQMQIYMLGRKLTRALYVAVNKNDDEYYMERLEYNPAVARKYLERGKRLVLDDRLPPPLSNDPTWYQCGFCAAKDFCHHSHLIKEVNCRTCAHASALQDSTWQCALHKKIISTDEQYDGCPSHVMHPSLVPWEILADKCTDACACYVVGGKEIMNGEGCFSSKEILEFIEKETNAQ